MIKILYPTNYGQFARKSCRPKPESCRLKFSSSPPSSQRFLLVLIVLIFICFDPLVCLHSLPTHEARGWSLATLAAGNSQEFLGGAGRVAR